MAVPSDLSGCIPTALSPEASSQFQIPADRGIHSPPNPRDVIPGPRHIPLPNPRDLIAGSRHGYGYRDKAR
jgi:hypothetical protein